MAEPVRGGRGRIAVFGVLVLLLLAGAGYAAYRYFGEPQVPVATAPPEPAKPEIAMTVEGARNFILTAKPSGADAAAMAQRFTQAGSLDGAFLLLQHAARNGDAKAAEQLGRLYDPKFFAAGKGPVTEASAERAIDWYERAAQAGDADAAARLAELRQRPHRRRSRAAHRRPRKPIRDVRRTPSADCGHARLGRPRPGAAPHAPADRRQDDALPARPDPARGQDRRRGRRTGHDRGAALHAALRL